MSWTVTTSPARRDGGATKLVPWNTSTRPANHSTGGHATRAQASRSARAGTRRRQARTLAAPPEVPGARSPTGPAPQAKGEPSPTVPPPAAPAAPACAAAARSPARRQVKETRRSSATSPEMASASTNRATYWPTPVLGPSRGVASSPTLIRRATSPQDHPPLQVPAVDLGAARDLPAAAQHHRQSEEHTSELQSPCNLVCRLLLEKKKK